MLPIIILMFLNSLASQFLAVLFQYKDIPNNSTQTTTLTELRKYVQYHIQVLAYTRLGDGALSNPPVRVQTFEDGKANIHSPNYTLGEIMI
jgi:protein sidekick